MPIEKDKNTCFLEKTLVIAAPSFLWVTDEVKIFPHIIYGPRTIQFHVRIGWRERMSLLLFVSRVFVYFLIHKPKLILFAIVDKSVPYFCALKRKGLLSGTRLMFYSHCSFILDKRSLIKYVSAKDALQLDRIIYYARNVPEHQHALLRDKFSFIPWYAPGDYDFSSSVKQQNYVFSGGFSDRDFKSLTEAVRGLDVMLRIETDRHKYSRELAELPENCQVYFKNGDQRFRTDITPENKKSMRCFLEIMAGALFVIVPLKRTLLPRGLTTILQALRLGKPVITTTNPALDGYITDGIEGFRVSPGDIQGYREAINKLLTDPELRENFSRNAKAKGETFTPEAVIGKIADLCQKELSI